MTQKEIEDGIEELDKRVERLRAMYDQYFLGIERLEPQVQRKDVERRFYQLRREKIRNTAVRFRFNQLCQRFTTYQTFWQRVARQIEEGTYRRDVLKVRQKLELQRLDRRKERLRRAGGAEEEDEGLDIEVDVDLDEGADDEESAWAAQALADFDSQHSNGPEPQVAVHELASEVRAITKALEQVQAPADPAVLTFGKLASTPVSDDDEDTTAAGQRKQLPPPPPVRKAALGRIALRRVTLGGEAGTTRDDGPPAPEQKSAEPPKVPPPPVRPTRTTGRGPALPAEPPAPVRPSFAPASAKTPSPPPPVRPVKSPSPPPPAPPAAAEPAKKIGPAADNDLRSLFLRRPRPTTSAKPPAAPAHADELPEHRVRAIYDQYRALRRQNNEGDVAFESVKKSIGEMLPKLREKAPGRQVDFEVVIKDGKTVLKPVAK